jgi:arylsulfatase A-like enzyme
MILSGDSVWIRGVLQAACVTLTCMVSLNAAERPNILLLFVDDLGYADLGCQGSSDVRTPNIDSIAKHGVRCTAGYATAPMCSPSRAGLLTGRYQQRFGHELNLGPVHTRNLGLPVSEKTIADRLKPFGYVSGVIGKWDLGSRPKYHPLSRGFDFFFGFLGGSRSHLPKPQKADFNVLLRNREPQPETGYSSDIYSQEAVAFIRRHRDAPFFLYVSYTAPHWPMEAKPEHLEKFTEELDLHRRTFLAMMGALDEGIGTILAAIQESGLDEQTLVLFVSDNGGPTGQPRRNPDAPFQYGQNTSRNDPLRGYKGQLYEGGIRVPFLVRWTGHLPEGTVCDTPFSTLDIATTAVTLAGGGADAIEDLDGINLIPLLADQEALSERPLFWRVAGQAAVRQGDWKLLSLPNQPPQLFDLSNDIAEELDIAATEADRTQSLRSKLAKWQEELRPPLWNPAVPRP